MFYLEEYKDISFTVGAWDIEVDIIDIDRESGDIDYSIVYAYLNQDSGYMLYSEELNKEQLDEEVVDFCIEEGLING